jgi:hypothetical protein
LVEYQGADLLAASVHDDVQRLAAADPGQWVAAEWRGPREWVRFLWCRK